MTGQRVMTPPRPTLAITPGPNGDITLTAVDDLGAADCRISARDAHRVQRLVLQPAHGLLIIDGTGDAPARVMCEHADGHVTISLTTARTSPGGRRTIAAPLPADLGSRLHSALHPLPATGWHG